MTPTQTIERPIQKTVCDLNTMENVTIKKNYTFTPAASAEEALQRVGNDSKKFLDILNEGLMAEARRTATADPNGYFLTDEEGDITTTPFTGTVGDPKAVGNLVLTLAKTIFGYKSEAPLSERQAAKKSAMDFIKSNEQIRENLRKNAAAAPAEE